MPCTFRVNTSTSKPRYFDLDSPAQASIACGNVILSVPPIKLMKLLWPCVCFAVALCAFPLVASDTYEQELSSTLVNHTAVLRNYYTDQSLTFDSNGTLISKGTAGFGPSDGRVYIKQIQLEPGKLILSGTRTLNVFNPTKREWEIAPTATPVSVEILLPNDELVNAAAPGLINTVFLKKSELAAAQCTVEEKKDFAESRLAQHTKGNNAPKSQDGDAASSTRFYCLPGGERVARVGDGVTAPHAKYTPDPTYTHGARDAKIHGTTVLLAVITPQGTPTAISIERSLGDGLSSKLRQFGYQLDIRAVEAVSQWKFQPATFRGKAVPVMINIEVNFKLY